MARRIIGHAVTRACLFVTMLLAGSGCLPESFIITPIAHKQALEETVLDRPGLFVRDRIAVIDVDGIILNASSGSLLTPRENPVVHLLEQLDAARHDPRVKAVVLRVNSPGGSVTASELMHSEIIRFREAGKPVVVMMLDVAASGAYYISCAADEIVAAHSTVTGSIGVIMQTFDATGTMQKIGVRADAIKSGDQKGAGSPFESMTPEQRAVFQNMINELYGQFVDVVALGRELPRDKVAQLADGRIYTASQALELGLIDRIGNMHDAIDAAKEHAGIERAVLVTYTRPYGFAPNYYADQPAQPAQTQVNLLNVEMGGLFTSVHPPFMYLWSH